jgi:hypothetical protein
MVEDEGYRLHAPRRKLLMEYRLYFLGADHHINDVEMFKKADDDQAVVFATEQAGDRPIELWALDRMVMRKVPSE